ncbi:putative nitrate ABC transporter, periplasmic protein [Actinomadura sp. NBRC 104425]|uniref:ABC transporter substrate-binding protein n=1 Tax=Actinomadura sp. NBRC 104425 TaxID=3032204 RepID=UPI0024A4ADA4|nr:ABC transporter substrate-binding protein [Actinomadura sp. NBRC 104425]GLZ10429.1 putative nitrate ABC transporter, periplasmic protein [Actinomadura sp. NBRC 104425]
MRKSISRKAAARRAAAVAAALSAATGCTVAGNAASDGGDGAVRVVVGYQSKTINTVTAGTLLRSLGAFERRLNELGKAEGRRYTVVWQDYDTGAPITAQMLAGKIDIGSMGDYPLLINGSRAQAQGDDARTEMVSVTGYNMRGSLNGVVVAANSSARTLADLRGGKVSASVGSAGHGTFVQAAKRYGLDPAKDVTVENQQPSVGASALQAGSVAGLAQFVAWPGLLVNRGQARLLYDGGDLNVPTFHGVVVRKAFAGERPKVLQAFLQAQIDATRYLHANPVKAAETVASATGLPVETVYLYNGAGGVAIFDPTIKPKLRDALAHDVPFLKSIGVLQQPLDLKPFINDGYLRQVYGAQYDRDVASTANPAAIKGTDRVCDRQVEDPAKAGEVWVAGEAQPRPVADPVCLLRNVRAVQDEGKRVRAVYIPDAATATRWFADKDVWVEDPSADKGERFKPFATQEGAQKYVSSHSGAKVVSYDEAVKRA